MTGQTQYWKSDQSYSSIVVQEEYSKDVQIIEQKTISEQSTESLTFSSFDNVDGFSEGFFAIFYLNLKYYH